MYPVNRSSTLGFLLLACWGAGAGVLTLWVLAGPVLGLRSAAGLLLAACTGAAAWVSWQTRRNGHVAWDGECWHWDAGDDMSSSEESKLSVVADIQSALLLSFEAEGRAKQWLWVDRASQPERWMDLRRAVYSPRRAPAAFKSLGD